MQVNSFYQVTPALTGKLATAETDRVDALLGELITEAIEKNQPQLVENFVEALDLPTLEKLAKKALDWKEATLEDIFKVDRRTWGPLKPDGVVEKLTEQRQSLADSGRRFWRHVTAVLRAATGLSDTQEEIYGRYQAQQILLFYKQIALLPVTVFGYLAIRIPSRKRAMGATALIFLALALLSRPLFYLLKERPNFDSRDLILKARDGKLPSIEGRTEEIKLIQELLLGAGRSTPVLLLGQTGEGKSALVEGLAQKLVREKRGDVRILRLNASIFRPTGTNSTAMLIAQLREELRKEGDKTFVLFVDEIHGLPKEAVTAFKQLMDEFPENITMVGATTTQEFEKHLKANEAFARRFLRISLKPLDQPATLQVLEQLLDGDEREWMASKEMLQEVFRRASVSEEAGSTLSKALQMMGTAFAMLTTKQALAGQAEIEKIRTEEEVLARKVRQGGSKKGAAAKFAQHEESRVQAEQAAATLQQSLRQWKALRQLRITWINRGRKALHEGNQKIALFALSYFHTLYPETEEKFKARFDEEIPLEVSGAFLDTLPSNGKDKYDR